MVKNFKNKKLNTTSKEIFSLNFNLTILLLGIMGIVFLFTIPLPRASGVEVANWTTFKFYTTDSNILMMIASIIYITYIILKWQGKIKDIPTWCFVFKLTGTLSVGLTMFITLFILLPGAFLTKVYPPATLYLGSNLIFHLFLPLVSVITFLLFENKKDADIKHTLWTLVPLVVYCIFYLSMAYTHVGADGKIPMKYDWYKFCSFGIGGTIGLVFGIFGIYYLFAWLLWLGNKRISFKNLDN